MSKIFTRDPNFVQIITLCSALRYPDKRIITELEKEGYGTVTRQTISKVKKKLKNSLSQDINDALEFGIMDEHFNAIKAIKFGQKIMWEQVEKETDPQTKSNIVVQVLQTYQYLSAYYLNIKRVMMTHKSVKIPRDIIPV